MAIKVAIANQKGGVGKTTISLHTLWAAVKQGLRVLAIDMDAQGNMSDILADFETEEGILLTRERALDNLPDDITRSVDLFMPPEDIGRIKPLRCSSGIDLIPTMINDKALYSLEGIGIEHVLYPNINIREIEENYDLIVIDSPPNQGRLLQAVLGMATDIITPVQVSGFAVHGVHGLMEVVREVQDSINPEVRMSGIVINSYNSRTVDHRLAVAELRKAAGKLVIDHHLGFRGPIDRAVHNATPVWDLKTGAARAAASEMKLVTQEILKRVGISAKKKKVSR